MMRDKRRYILVGTSEPITAKDQSAFEIELYKNIMAQLGEAEYFTANPKIMKFTGPSEFILRVGLEKYDNIIVALALIKRFGEGRMGLYTLKSSGTIRALQKPANGI